MNRCPLMLAACCFGLWLRKVIPLKGCRTAAESPLKAGGVAAAADLERMAGTLVAQSGGCPQPPIKKGPETDFQPFFEIRFF